ncbi:MAG: hypothetical protein MRK00_16495 [Nitrosomonas sp.]|nr:hypothetical protein [Nitrosomonas sp.]
MQFTQPLPNTQNMTEQQFDAAMNLLFTELPAFAAYVEAAVQAFDLNAMNSTSSTSVAMALTQKTITVQTNKSYFPGQRITVARTSAPTTNMVCLVISYNPSTGALVFLPQELNGSGTFSDWSVSFYGAVPVMADNEITLVNNAGVGTTNTAIQRYGTVQKNTGGIWMSYSSSPTLGDSILIDKTGDYEVTRYGSSAAAGAYIGASRNSGGLSTSFITRMNTNMEEFILGSDTLGTTSAAFMSRTMRFNAGDVIRPHNNANSAETDNGYVSLFSVKRLGFI